MSRPMLDVSFAAIHEAMGDIAVWSQQCHAASLHLVRSGVLGPKARVARGACLGVYGQHSWVVLGDPYDRDAVIVDVTAWSYDERRPEIWVTSIDWSGAHLPKGAGQIWEGPIPHSGGGEEITLTEPEGGWSPAAKSWFRTFRSASGGPLDVAFWMRLFSHSPVGGWPAAEFVSAGYRTDNVRGLIPVDIVGMLCPDLNPGGLYR